MVQDPHAHIKAHLQTHFYKPESIAPGLEHTALLLANELASPLYAGNEQGNFGNYAEHVSDLLEVPVFAVQRLGSADIAPDAQTRELLMPANRQATMRTVSEITLERLRSRFPGLQRIVIAGHSAGAAQGIEITDAIGAHDLLRKANIGHVALEGLVAIDPPRERQTLIGGIVRYVLYGRYVAPRFKEDIPAKLPTEMQHATPGVEARQKTDITYNIHTWRNGFEEHIERIATTMPNTGIYLAPTRRSPNNIGRHPNHLHRYVGYVCGLRETIPDSRPCRAEILPGPHGLGSRPQRMAEVILASELLHPDARGATLQSAHDDH